MVERSFLSNLFSYPRFYQTIVQYLCYAVASLHVMTISCTPIKKISTRTGHKALRRLRQWFNAEARPYQRLRISHLEPVKLEGTLQPFSAAQNVLFSSLYVF